VLLSDLPLQIDYLIWHVTLDTPAIVSVSLNHFCRVEKKNDNISVIMAYIYSQYNSRTSLFVCITFLGFVFISISEF